MEHDIALAVGKALFQKLGSFHEIEGRPLVSILQVEQHGILNRVTLNFGAVSLSVNATDDDDSIDFKSISASELKTAGDCNSQSEFWKDFVGLPFGWGWITIN
ncbi:MAG: DUF6334 family protein, partial [Acidobacteriota bacterium]|nr:DUF6334 family protein [Acidobacteriota bacterium]